MCHGCNSSCTPNRVFYFNDASSGIFCWKLERYSIARMVRCHTENRPEMKVIDFDNEPVDIKRANRFFTHIMNHCDDRFDASFFLKKEFTPLPLLRCLKSPGTQFFNQGIVGRFFGNTCLMEFFEIRTRIGKKEQVTFSSDGRI